MANETWPSVSGGGRAVFEHVFFPIGADAVREVRPNRLLSWNSLGLFCVLKRFQIAAASKESNNFSFSLALKAVFST